MLGIQIELVNKDGCPLVINNVLIQWYSGNYWYATSNKVFVFPVAYTINYWIFGAGFWVDAVAAQELYNITLTGFTTGSAARTSGTTGWITIGN